MRFRCLFGHNWKYFDEEKNFKNGILHNVPFKRRKCPRCGLVQRKYISEVHEVFGLDYRVRWINELEEVDIIINEVNHGHVKKTKKKTK